MTKTEIERKGGHVRALFMVAQRVVLFNVNTRKYCIAKVANASSDFSKKYGPWDIFGGHIDKGECIPEDAVRREVEEESGITIKEVLPLRAIDFSGYGSDRDKSRQRILIGYFATCETDAVTLSDEHSEYQWLTAEEIAQHKKVGRWIKDFIVLAEERRKEREALAGWQRCIADFDNYKKRQSESVQSSMQYAKEDMITRLLPVLDNFHASIDHVPAEHADSPWVTGLGYIRKQLADILSESGLREMPVRRGDVFDPAKHEAVKDDAQRDGDREGESDVKKHAVTRVVTRGYLVGDKVIRPARVVVDGAEN